MITHSKSNIKYLQFSNLSKFENLNHFSSTRIGGLSSKKLESLNLAYTVNDNPKNVSVNLELLANTLGFERKQIKKYV